MSYEPDAELGMLYVGICQLILGLLYDYIAVSTHASGCRPSRGPGKKVPMYATVTYGLSPSSTT
jgi:hypothetical protein